VGTPLLEQTVLANSCPLEVLDFGGNYLAISSEMAFSATFKVCPRSHTAYTCVASHTYYTVQRYSCFDSQWLTWGVTLRGGQVYHTESIPVIPCGTHTRAWLPTLGALCDTEAARKGIPHFEGPRTTNKELSP